MIQETARSFGAPELQGGKLARQSCSARHTLQRCMAAELRGTRQHDAHHAPHDRMSRAFWDAPDADDSAEFDEHAENVGLSARN